MKNEVFGNLSLQSSPLACFRICASAFNCLKMNEQLSPLKKNFKAKKKTLKEAKEAVFALKILKRKGTCH